MLPPQSIPQKSTPSHHMAGGSTKTRTDSVSHQTPESGPSTQAETQDGEHFPTEQAQERIAELKQHIDPALQICRYLLEMFSIPLLRSHANASLVDRDRLQLYHANRSVIMVSSAINFAKEESEGKDKFIATIIAFHCLTPEQNGIIGNQIPGLKNAELMKRNNFGEDRVVQEGHELDFSGDAKGKELKVILEDVVSREPAMVGRSTVVLNARVEGGDSKEILLVVKASWPTSGRVSETAFLEKACSTAVGEQSWAANHLPQVHHAEDVVPSSDSILDSVTSLFEGAKFAGERSFVYEPRVLRIIVQERLVPLRYLPSVREIGQVFLDIACGTCDGFRFWRVLR